MSLTRRELFGRAGGVLAGAALIPLVKTEQVKAPAQTEVHTEIHPTRVETFIGDGFTRTFRLHYTVDMTLGYVVHAGVYETLTTTDYPGTAMWELDATKNTITRAWGAPRRGDVVKFTFDGHIWR